MILSKKIKICTIINSRANYGRIHSFLDAAKRNSKIDLTIILGSSAVLQKYGDISPILKKDGFKIYKKIYNIVETDTPSGMAKSTALLIVELTSIFEDLKPDYVVSVADRYENLAQAIAASYLNIPVVHTQGGELTGSIDESVRHSITKLAHIHFPSTLKAKKNLLQLGEDPSKIFMVGCPSLDFIDKIDKNLGKNFFKKNLGLGSQIDQKKPYLTIVQHPVTTEYGSGLEQITNTLKAVCSLDIQKIWLWPNIDAGSDQISKALRTFKDKGISNFTKVRFYKNFSDKDYIRLINNTSCLVGNSSSAIREGSYLGVPSVNIGTRQNFRERGENVIDVNYNKNEILNAIKKHLKKNKKYKRSYLYGKGNAGMMMNKILTKVKVNVQKKFYGKRK